MAVALPEERLLAFIERVRWSPDGRVAAVASVAAAAGVFLVIGSALAWSTPFVIGGAIAFAVTTWLARSLARATACLFGALGLLAAVFAACVMLNQGLLSSLHVTWTAAAIAWWGLVLGLGALFRRGRYDADFGLAELVGAVVTMAAGLSAWHKIDFSASLLRYLVTVEDNEAWVAVVTQVHGTHFVGPGFVEHFDGRGPVIATLLGLLAVMQRSDVPLYNAAFAAWALAVLLAPLCATALLRRLSVRSAVATVAFGLIVIAWAWHVPFLLFASYGHLTATWAFLFLLVAVATLSGDIQRAPVVPATVGLVFAMGAVWYPIFPLGLAGFAFVALRAWRADRGWVRIACIALAVLGALVLLLQMAQAVGLVSAPPGVSFGLKTLYAAQGGTAALDTTLGLIVIAGVLGLGFLAVDRLPPYVDVIWRVLVTALVYVAAVFVGAFFMKTGLGYGPTKVWYILGFSAAVVLVSVAPRFTLRPRAAIVTVIALSFGALLFGGAGEALSRSWPGGGSEPAWLPALLKATAGDRDPVRPLACVSNDKYSAYMCTRWAAGLTTGEDQPYLGYRINVMSDQDPTAEIAKVVADGTAAQSDVIVLDTPDAGHAWAWPLVTKAAQVFGPDGSVLDPRPTPPAGS